ncbi:MAG: DUF5916 domain-containing protein [Candidatus Eisenbacteria bacterium]
MTLALIGALTRGASAVPAPPHAPIRATRTTAAITIDGVLDEPAWSDAQVVTEFYQQLPDQGQPCSQRTEVRVLFDDDALYVGARLFDSSPDSMISRLSRRDESVPADRFSVYLDPYHDKRSGYYFLVNCAGTQFDGTLSNDGNEDASWDGVWKVRVRRDPQGWVAEYRIPFSQLRFQNAEHQVWGINFRRVLPRRNEESFLAYQPRNESGFVSRWPDLVGLDGVQPRRTVELLPYMTSKGEFTPHAPADPFHDGSDVTPAAGLDLRTSVGSRMTLNATVNPDFGQVEVDPAVVNLSDVETFFQEKRPFFVEGSSVFNFGNEGASNYWGFNWQDPKFFYSRRVGRTPQGELPGADYVDTPVGTTILGAAKVIGKISPTVNFGTLHAVTAKEEAQLYAAGNEWSQPVEPLSYYQATRVQKEFKDRRQGLGFMTTIAMRSFDDASLRDQLNRTSLMGGMDGWVFLDPKRTWVLSGWSVLSYVGGTAARMVGLQQDQRHYFQRPDAGYLGVDSAATSLTGFGTRVWLNKEKGRWISNSAIGFVNPRFDVNDVGYQTQTDVINGHIGGGYRWSDPGKVRRYTELIGAVFGSSDFGGDITSAGGWASNYSEFNNNWWINPDIAYNPQTVSIRRTRGGPRMLTPPGYQWDFSMGTDQKQKFYLNLSGGQYIRERGSIDTYMNASVELKPLSSLKITMGPGYEFVREYAQYVTTLDDPAAVETYGKSYVFALLHQNTVYGNFRISWAFTPTICLQAFVQPYVSTGVYEDFRALARPNTYDFVQVAPPFDPNFNYASLRGNAVFRWEYMPGSAFYFVWTQQREDVTSTGEFNPGHDFTQMFQKDADNIFLAKVTYYLPL